MVKRENIIEGCKRFALGFKKVLESPQLPEVEQLIETYARIRGLSDQELTTRLHPIGEALKRLCRTEPALAQRHFQDVIESGKYLPGMNREEGENLLMSEFVKLAVAKKSFLHRSP